MSTANTATIPKGRILIADDEATFLHATADLLRRGGYDVETCPDGLAAAALLNVAEFDLLIADIQMPGNPQLELIRHLPQIALGMPVLIVTGYPTLESEIRSADLPVLSYMVKPVKFEELLVQVQSAVARSEPVRRAKALRARLSHFVEDLDGLIRVMDTSVPKSLTPQSLTTLALKNQIACLALLEEMWAKLAANAPAADGAPGHREHVRSLIRCLSETLHLTGELKSVDA